MYCSSKDYLQAPANTWLMCILWVSEVIDLGLLVEHFSNSVNQQSFQTSVILKISQAVKSSARLMSQVNNRHLCTHVSFSSMHYKYPRHRTKYWLTYTLLWIMWKLLKYISSHILQLHHPMLHLWVFGTCQLSHTPFTDLLQLCLMGKFKAHKGSS